MCAIEKSKRLFTLERRLPLLISISKAEEMTWKRGLPAEHTEPDWTGGIIVGMWLHSIWREEEMKPGHLKEWGAGGRGWRTGMGMSVHS